MREPLQFVLRLVSYVFWLSGVKQTPLTRTPASVKIYSSCRSEAGKNPKKTA